MPRHRGGGSGGQAVTLEAIGEPVADLPRQLIVAHRVQRDNTRDVAAMFDLGDQTLIRTIAAARGGEKRSTTINRFHAVDKGHESADAIPPPLDGGELRRRVVRQRRQQRQVIVD